MSFGSGRVGRIGGVFDKLNGKFSGLTKAVEVSETLGN